MLRVAIIVACALQACGPRSTDSQQPDGTSTGDPDPDATAPGPSCPTRFDVAMQGGTCTADSRCTYAQAECHCVGQPPCSGVDPGPDYRPTYVWSCVVRDPAVLREDGCPAKLPEQHQRCRENGKVCHYSPYCGGIQSTARCSGRAWQLEQIMISPPPASEG